MKDNISASLRSGEIDSKCSPMFLLIEEWFSSVSYLDMKLNYPDSDSLSDESIREALATNGIEGFFLLDADGQPVPMERRVEVFRELLREDCAIKGETPMKLNSEIN